MSTFTYTTVRSLGTADCILPSHASAVRFALSLATSRVNVPVDVLDGRGVIVDSFTGRFDAMGRVVIQPNRARVGLAGDVELGCIAGLASVA